MKKLTAIICVIITVCICCVTALAETDMYSDAGELYNAWCEDMPDYICGVWSTDGSMNNLTFGVAEGDEGERGRQEILDLVADDSSVSFATQKYSLNYLNKIQDELIEYFELDLGCIATGAYQMENCVGLSIDAEYKDNPDTQAMVAALTEKYGDAIRIEYNGKIVLTEAEAAADEEEKAAPWLIAGSAAAVLALASAAVCVVCRKRAAQKTTAAADISDTADVQE